MFKRDVLNLGIFSLKCKVLILDLEFFSSFLLTDFLKLDLLLVNEKMYVFIKIVFIALFCYRANRNSAAAS